MTAPRDELVERIAAVPEPDPVAIAAEVRAWIRERIPEDTVAGMTQALDTGRMWRGIGWNNCLALIRERLGL